MKDFHEYKAVFNKRIFRRTFRAMNLDFFKMNFKGFFLKAISGTKMDILKKFIFLRTISCIFKEIFGSTLLEDCLNYKGNVLENNSRDWKNILGKGFVYKDT